MRNQNILLVILLGLITVQCTSDKRPRVVERPLYGLQNPQPLEIDKVELNDSSTILYMDVYFDPNQWIRIDSGTYLKAGEQKYLIQGSENIVLNEYHWMPESGEDHFKLIFPPLPKGTKSFDFIESDCDDCFKIWDIDLTGTRKEYMAQLPSDILKFKVDIKDQLSEPTFKVGQTKTKVKIFIRGLNGELTPRLSLGMNTIVSQNGDSPRPIKVGENEYWFEFDQFTSLSAYLLINGQSLEMLIEPGEITEVYFDAVAYSRRNSRYHPQTNLVYAGFRGVYANINNQLLQDPEARSTNYSFFEDVNELLNIDPDDYVSIVCKRYEDELERLIQADMSESIRQLNLTRLKVSLISHVISKSSCYTQVNRVKDPNYQPPKLTSTDLKSLQTYQINDPYGVYDMAYIQIANRVARTFTFEQINEMTGSSSGFLQDMFKSVRAFDLAAAMRELPEYVKENLESTSSSFYPEVYTFLVHKYKEEYEGIFKKGGFEIIDTPDVKPEQIIEAIVDQYKGEVIFIDYWATWCGPCINAMKTIQSIKPEMKDLGVVSVYISNESSPKNRWLSMLPDIGGVHYYLTEEQWRAVSSKYGIKGIPTYMVFDKDGKKVFESVGFPGNEKVLDEIKKVL